MAKPQVVVAPVLMSKLSANAPVSLSIASVLLQILFRQIYLLLMHHGSSCLVLSRRHSLPADFLVC